MTTTPQDAGDRAIDRRQLETVEELSSRSPSGTGREELALRLAAARPAALAAAMRRLPAERAAAVDVVDDVIGRLWERGPVPGRTYTDAYVVRCVENAVVDRWRAQVRAQRRLHQLAADPDEGADHGVPDRLDVARALLELPPRQREVVRLRYFEQLSYKEIADCTGMPVGSVGSTLSRALAALGTVLRGPRPGTVEDVGGVVRGRTAAA